ncbi:sialate O-acetylesterase [uncultured Stenotrophomonas sp.]|uniref:sialate O-acetylesterase n=1 Tax=uncultured Stenotrophomonas sp. TaxID=165438 RepID=UPI0028E2E04B|nr:sialate O-acetylesterase [uncultured Stenotrophomonas sp.]
MSRSSLSARVLLAAALATTSTLTMAQPSKPSLLHPLFRDHAVLQRDQPIPVWGEAEPGASVSVAFSGHTRTLRADANGDWHTTLPPTAAGGPYQLTVRAGQVTQIARDLKMGDVWLCSGQSNMELPVWRSLDASSELAAAAHPDIRLFSVPKAAAVSPQETFKAPVAWTVATPDTVREFSAACYYFARELQKTINVPMGLIQAAWGGSRIEPWTSAAALRAQGGMETSLDVLAQHAHDPAGASRRWGEHWQQWWTTREDAAPGDTPWQPGNKAGEWHDAPASLGAWERWGVPALAAYNGMVWYRTQVTLTAAQAAQRATLELGAVDETDMTWVNGVGVGSENRPGDARAYPLAPGVLKAGTNTVVINALDTWGDGGLAGPTTAQALRFEDGTQVVLGPRWQYRIAPSAESPPLAPWHAATGLSTLYNGMIAPLGNVGLRGALWYQGESNTGDGAAYADRLRVLRDDWRSHFGTELPFLIVQLAGYGKPPELPVESGWAQVREAQRRVAAEDPHSGLALAIDIGDTYDIHPPNKQELGRRLARLARQAVYGDQTVLPTGPVPRSASRTQDGVRVAFDGVSGSLITTGAAGPIGFELCGPGSNHCAYADAALDGHDVVLRGASAGTAVRVRYCWADGPVCTLRDSSGAPAGPFELSLTDPEVR